MCASHIWFPTPTPGRVGISPDIQSLPRDCKSFFSPPLEEHRQVSSDLGTASTSMNLPPGFPGGGRDTKYLKHTSFTYIMYIDGWKGPFPWPAHPALICRNRYYVSIHHNSSIPKQKMCFRKRKKIQVISWNHQDVLVITQKWFYWTPRQILRYFEARIVKIWCTELILWQKLTENKYLSTWKLWFPLNWLIFNLFWCSFF